MLKKTNDAHTIAGFVTHGRRNHLDLKNNDGSFVHSADTLNSKASQIEGLVESGSVLKYKGKDLAEIEFKGPF